LLAASTFAAAARVLLGVAVLVAGGTKIAAMRRWRDEARGLGVPQQLAVALPWIEVAIGALIVSGFAAPWPTVAALGVLGAYTLWIVGLLVRGRHPPCACFGALSAAPLSWRHVARNGVLIVLGALAISG
jgi:uncharacterized membrane protein YphA (DoxX/SURF4 family)